MRFIRELPLLGKELIEQSNRLRTYIVRVVYAAVLFVVFGAFLYSVVAEDGTISLSSLGQGAKAFELVIAAQLVGIFLLMPALIADVVTRERENQCLDLLLITQLKPTDIVLQKLLSRFIPMGTFLLLSMPLIAVAYAYGGVDAARMWTAGYVVVLTCAWVGSLCMVLCVDAQKTSMALLGCYVRMPMSLLLLSILSLIVGAGMYGAAMLAELIATKSGWTTGDWKLEFAWFAGAMVPPFSLWVKNPAPFWLTVFATAPSWLVVLWYIRKAKRMLVMSVFSATEARAPSFEIARLPNRKERPRGDKLPEDRPVEWLELNSRTMRQLWKVFVFACIVDLPLLIYLATQFNLSYQDYQREQLLGFGFLAMGQWLIGAIVLGLMAGSVFAPERQGRTLAVLLATPMDTREMVTQKMAGARRLAWVFLLPMGAVLGCEWYYESITFGAFKGWDAQMLLYLLAVATTLGIYPWLAVWLGMWVGLRIRDRTRAAITFLVLVLLWIFVVPVVIDTALELGNPLQASFYLDEKGEPRFSVLEIPAWLWVNDLRLLSPAELVRASEGARWSERLVGPPWLLVLLNGALYAGLTLWLRWRCLRNANRWLGRV